MQKWVWAAAIGVAAGLLGGGARPAAAQTVLNSGAWTSFGFEGSGAYSYSPAPPFTFTAVAGARLRLTDAYSKGDRFRIYNHGIQLGDTTSVPASESGVTVNPDTAWADPTYSKGEFLLGAGAHSITIQSIEAPYGSGAAYIRWDEAEAGDATAAPEPGAVLLFLPALGVVALARRKRTA